MNYLRNSRSLFRQTLGSVVAIGTILLVASASAAAADDAEAKSGSTSAKLTIHSSAFKEGQRIPDEYTSKGKNISPPLDWGAPPAGTKSFALICEDPDAPVGNWVHWIVYDIPGAERGLKENVPPQETLPDGTAQGLNSWSKVGYGGPSPPPGKAHRYFFKLYALDRKLSLGRSADKAKLAAAMKGHVLAEAQTMGTFSR